MDVLLLGAAAIVLLVLTIWIVWRPSTSDAGSATEEATRMMPQGDQFEDQYTSATADLSAAGVALTTAGAPQEAEAPPTEVPVQQVSTTPPWPRDTPHPTGSATGYEPIRRLPADDVSSPKAKVAVGTAAGLALGAAIAGGALAYARWQRQRNKPLNRLRRRFR